MKADHEKAKIKYIRCKCDVRKINDSFSSKKVSANETLNKNSLIILNFESKKLLGKAKGQCVVCEKKNKTSEVQLSNEIVVKNAFLNYK